MMTDIPRETLTKIIQDYGVSIIGYPDRIESLLRDLCPSYKKEIKVLVSAAKEGLPEELLSEGNMAEATLSRYRVMLTDDHGYSQQVSVWAVTTWAYVLGIKKHYNAISTGGDPLMKGHEPDRQRSRSLMSRARYVPNTGIPFIPIIIEDSFDTSPVLNGNDRLTGLDSLPVAIMTRDKTIKVNYRNFYEGDPYECSLDDLLHNAIILNDRFMEAFKNWHMDENDSLYLRYKELLTKIDNVSSSDIQLPDDVEKLRRECNSLYEATTREMMHRGQLMAEKYM